MQNLLEQSLENDMNMGIKKRLNALISGIRATSYHVYNIYKYEITTVKSNPLKKPSVVRRVFKSPMSWGEGSIGPPCQGTRLIAESKK
jgi:hypothetical protein